MMSRTEPSEVVAGVVTGVMVEVRDLQGHGRASTADRAALVGARRFQGAPRVALMPLGAGIARLRGPIDEVLGRAHHMIPFVARERQTPDGLVTPSVGKQRRFHASRRVVITPPAPFDANRRRDK